MPCPSKYQQQWFDNRCQEHNSVLTVFDSQVIYDHYEQEEGQQCQVRRCHWPKYHDPFIPEVNSPELKSSKPEPKRSANPGET